MAESESFFALSPERVLQAVAAADLEPSGHCFTLNALENRVYDVRLEDGRHVVAKFYRPGRWSRETILDEHRLLAALDAAEIPVCRPLRLPDGGTLAEILGIHYALWPRAGGRAPDEFSDAQVRVLGRLLARIHDVAEGCDLGHRRELSPETFPLEALALLEDRRFLPRACAGRFRAAVEALCDLYVERSRGLPSIAIHGDCHRGNLLHGDAGWLFLDFDDMVHGPAVQDVWMLLPGRDAFAARQRAILVEAYREQRDLDVRGLELIEVLRGFRFVVYAGWIARRWEDPAFPDAFPHFGTDQYWEGETRDLEELLELIARGSPMETGPGHDDAGPMDRADESELTNADFFWDL